jgi:hypothetical protein
MLHGKKKFWPPMNADERRFRTATLPIGVHLRSSAANHVFLSCDIGSLNFHDFRSSGTFSRRPEAPLQKRGEMSLDPARRIACATSGN